jgi:hippurate hydrolase
MISDGLFERFPMEAVFGMHNWPGAPVGPFAVSSGPVMASSNDFSITIHGKGGHAALPHNGIDPVPIACQMVQAFQTIVSRNVKPIDAAVISVTMIHAGEATNVVPDSCELQGTVRTFSLEVLDLIERACANCRAHLRGLGARCEFSFRRKYPPTVNSPAEARLRARSDGRHRRRRQRARAGAPMGAEDFAFMLQAKPGAYAFIANGDGSAPRDGPRRRALHAAQPSYDFNDELLPLGATFWVRLAEQWLRSRGSGERPAAAARP